MKAKRPRDKNTEHQEKKAMVTSEVAEAASEVVVVAPEVVAVATKLIDNSMKIEVNTEKVAAEAVLEVAAVASEAVIDNPNIDQRLLQLKVVMKVLFTE